MRKLFVLLCISLFSISPLTSALIIGFEDLTPTSEASQIDIPDGYMGFSWSDYFLGMTSGYLPGTGYANGTTGSMTAYTSYHKIVSMTSDDGSLFDFVGADITAGRLDDETVIVQGWRLGILIYSEDIVTSTDGPYSFTFNFEDVDTVKFIPNQKAGDHHIAIDQIEIIPEPATMLLLAVGGIVLFQIQSDRRLRHRRC